MQPYSLWVWWSRISLEKIHATYSLLCSSLTWWPHWAHSRVLSSTQGNPLWTCRSTRAGSRTWHGRLRPPTRPSGLGRTYIRKKQMQTSRRTWGLLSSKYVNTLEHCRAQFGEHQFLIVLHCSQPRAPLNTLFFLPSGANALFYLWRSQDVSILYTLYHKVYKSFYRCCCCCSIIKLGEQGEYWAADDNRE